MNGIWSSWTSDEINAAVVKCNSYRDSRIVAMAFGYGDSYVISYGTASNMKQLGNWFDLKGYYPDLYQTLQSNKPLSIYVSVWSQVRFYSILTATLGYCARSHEYDELYLGLGAPQRWALSCALVLFQYD